MDKSDKKQQLFGDGSKHLKSDTFEMMARLVTKFETNYPEDDPYSIRRKMIKKLDVPVIEKIALNDSADSVEPEIVDENVKTTNGKKYYQAMQFEEWGTAYDQTVMLTENPLRKNEIEKGFIKEQLEIRTKAGEHNVSHK